ncbi:MAG: copper amine oxidase N-terminal domain-containing protein [Caldisericia bacterium]|nr:copper amine oxidase N-terminal domain-containing protein [Caldisericia bacterium]
MKKQIISTFLVVMSFCAVFILPAYSKGSQWPVQIRKERKGKSNLAIKSLAVRDSGSILYFRCESWGNWNLGFGDNKLKVLINTEGKKNPEDKNTFSLEVMQIIPDCPECLMMSLFNLETNSSIPFFGIPEYLKDSPIMFFSLEKERIGLEGSHFSVSIAITRIDGSLVDFAPSDRSYVLFDSEATGPDPCLQVLETAFDLGKIAQSNDKKEVKFSVVNLGEGQLDVELTTSNEAITVFPQSFFIGDYDTKEVVCTIALNQLKIGKYAEKVFIKTPYGEKVISITFEITAIPKLVVIPMEMDFGVILVNEPKTKFLTIQNENPGPITGTLMTSDRRMALSIRSFNENRVDIEVTIKADNRIEILDAMITITSDGGKATIPIHAEIVDMIQFDQPKVDFGTIDITDPLLLKRTNSITNLTQRKVELKVTSNENWMDVQPKLITLTPGGKQIFEVELIKEVLLKNVNKYNGSVSVKSENKTWTIPVTVQTIKTNPKLIWLKEQSDSIDFKKPVVEGKSIKVKLVFSNAGTGKLKANASLKKENKWTVDKTEFELTNNETTALYLSMETKNLKEQIISNTLIVSSNGGELSIPFEVRIIPIPIVRIKLWIGKRTAFINENPYLLDEVSYIKNSTTMVPLRFISEAFNATVEWIAEGKGKIIITLGIKVIVLKIDQKIAYINDIEYRISTPPEIRKGRTFVPIRFISEAFGATIDWKAVTQEINITFYPEY